jgi:hypothetical protein
VVTDGVVLGAVELVVLCFERTRKPPPATTTSTSRATSRVWRVVSVAFMAFLSAGPAVRASLKRGMHR